MHSISSSKISIELIRIVSEAEKYIILVSPYNDWNNWHEFKRALKKALNKKLIVCLYLRTKDFDYPKFKYWCELGLRVFTIDNLHAKMYFNEKQVLLSSLNLLFYSVKHSLEAGIITSSQEKQEHLKHYFDLEIKFKGAEFIRYDEGKDDFDLCWFSSLKTVDMYFDW